MWVVVMLLVATLAGVAVYGLSLLDAPPWPRLPGRHASTSASPRSAAFDRASWEFARARSGALVQRAATAVRRLAPAMGPAVDVQDAPRSPGASLEGRTAAGGASAVAVEDGLAPPLPPAVPPGATGLPAPAPPAAVEPSPAHEEEGLLYVPVQRDDPTAHSRLLSALAMLALVLVAGAVLALAVWQATHLVAEAFHGVIGA